MSGLGVAAGLATAALWTITAICFEFSIRRLGSLAVNVLRLAIAAPLFLGLSLWRSGHLLPHGLSTLMWRELTLSGLVGFVCADLLLFEAVALIGARLSMLVYASVPTLTAIAGYLWLGERIGAMGSVGMFVTCVGIGAATLGKKSAPDAIRVPRLRGILLAFGGSAGQAAGLLLAKHGAGNLDPFAATEVRVLAGLTGFSVVVFLGRRTFRVLAPVLVSLGRRGSSRATAVRDLRAALLWLTVGAILGPFLGISLGLWSTQLLPAGIASTLMSLVPVLLVPASVLIFRERVTALEVSGTVVALVGVALLSL